MRKFSFGRRTVLKKAEAKKRMKANEMMLRRHQFLFRWTMDHQVWLITAWSSNATSLLLYSFYVV